MTTKQQARLERIVDTAWIDEEDGGCTVLDVQISHYKDHIRVWGCDRDGRHVPGAMFSVKGQNRASALQMYMAYIQARVFGDMERNELNQEIS